MTRSALPLAVTRAALVAVLGVLACTGGGDTPPPPPPASAFDDCSAGAVESVHPHVTCVASVGGKLTAIFGYKNDAAGTVIVPAGPKNTFVPELDPAIHGIARPPTVFARDTHRAAFAVSFEPTSSVTWQLGTESATATPETIACATRTVDGATVVELGEEPGIPPERLVIARDPGAALAGVLEPTPTPLDGKVVGEVGGTFDVSDDGAARYTIPLWVPPGRAGVQPSLGLAYSSRSGNGILGVGWSLLGFSEIASCTESKVGLCIDGDPLVAVPKVTLVDRPQPSPGIPPVQPAIEAAAVPAPTEYRPKHDPFTRVLVEGSDALGPTAFVVQRRDGRVLRYGGAGHLLEGEVVKVDQSGGEVLDGRRRRRIGWLLAELSDRSENRVEFKHLPTVLLGGAQPCTAQSVVCAAVEMVPHSITYTHGRTGAATRRIELRYDTSRGDTELVFADGVAMKRTALLVGIDAYGPSPRESALLRRYRFSYDDAFVSERKLLRSVEECVVESGAEKCKPATTFEYERGAKTFERTVVGSYGSGHPLPSFDARFQTPTLVADFDGDGRDDVFYFRSGRWYWRKSTGTGFDAEQAVDVPVQRNVATVPPPVVATLRGPDGPVIMFPYIKRLHAKTGTTTAVRLTYHRVGFRDGVLKPLEATPDVNTSEEVDDPKSSWEPQSWIPSFDGVDEPIAASRSDDVPVFAAPVQRPRAYWQLRKQVGATYENATVPVQGIHTFLDVNGDGIADDFVQSKTRGGPWDLFLGTGGDAPPFYDGGATPKTRAALQKLAFSVPPEIAALQPAAQEARGLMPLDIRQTGKPDLFLFGGLVREALPAAFQGALLRFRVATAAAFVTAEPGPMTSGAGSRPVADGNLGLRESEGAYLELARVLDVDGDGLEDLLLPERLSSTGPISQWVLYRRTGKRADLLKRVVNGLGSTLDIVHEPLRSSRSESVCASAGFADDGLLPSPVRALRCDSGGLWVVKRYTDPAGRSFTFSYEDPVTDGAVDGFLGFRRRTVTHVQTGTTTVTEYGRYYERFRGVRPFARVPTRIETRVQLEDRTVRREIVETEYDLSAVNTFPLDGTVDVFKPRARVIRNRTEETRGA